MNRIVIGTWGISGDFGNVSPKDIQDVLTYSYENGIKEFDTAPSYGNGFMEFCLGSVFKGCTDVLINTKVGNTPFYGKDFKLNSLSKSIDESLKRLNGLSINTLFLHNPRDVVPYVTYGYMNALKDEGVIKSIGLSMAKNFEYPKEFINEFDVVQDDFNLLYLKPLEYIDKIKPRFMARSVLASGLLTSNEKTFSSSDIRSEWLTGERLESLNRRVRVLKEKVATDTLSSFARHFVFSNSSIDKIIFGVKNRQHIDDVIEDSNKAYLPKFLIKEYADLYNVDFYLKDEGKYRY
jgi:aryl-alcohol dehydrogenase-like predicted oxidoreductase